MNINKIHFRRMLKPALITLLVLFVLWIGSMVVVSGLLLNRVGRLRQMAADPAQIQLNIVATELHGVRREYSVLHTELAPLLWLSSLFSGDVGAIKPFMDAGSELLIAGDESLKTLSPSLGTLDIASISAAKLPEILDALATARPELASAKVHVDSAAAALIRIKGPLSTRVEHWSSLARQAVQLAQIGLQGVQIAPALLGQSGPRTYLILLQNSDELRATGGFISAIGVVHVDNGKLLDMSIKDSYAVENYSKWHPDPPVSLLKYMLAQQWVVRDANWSPDFPTAARDAIKIYQVSNPGQVDGVIGITVQGVGMFIAGLSPLEVAGLPEPVTPANFSAILQETWNPPPDLGDSSADLGAWWANRKQAIGLVMKAAMEKILGGQANWAQLSQGIIKAFDQRQLMVFSVSEADELDQMDWDGSLRSSPGDYLMVVDSNVGFNKVNPLISERLKYQVALQPDGTGRAAVDIDYAHQGKRGEIVCEQFKLLNKNVTYDQLTQTCYFDYLRIISPPGSSLLQAEPQPTRPEYLLPGVPADGRAGVLQDELIKRTTFGQFFVVEYGKQLHTHFEYELPAIVRDTAGGKAYILLVQKQAGTNALPLKVIINLPLGSRLVSSSPLPTRMTGASLEYDLQLDVDRQIDVVYTLAP